MNVRILMAVTTLASVGMLSSQALAQSSCNVDTDCACGDVCSWATATHVCVSASTGEQGWCDSTVDCLYASQTCDTNTNACTPAFNSSDSLCVNIVACTDDVDCSCGDVCAWDLPGGHHCVAANTGDTGWCGGTCLYEGQTCSGTSCAPAWSETSICDQGTTSAGNSTTTGAAATTAAATGTTGAAGTTAAASTSGTSEGSGTTAAAAGTTGAASGTTGAAAGTTGAAAGTTSSAAATTSAAAAGTTAAAAASSTGSAAAASGTSGAASSTSGASGTTSGGANTCTNDDDCACGQLCSWANSSDHHCIAAVTTDPGWCSAGATNTCLYDGQTCKGTACSPAWSSTSVCDKSTTSATSGTTTGADGGSGGGGGGCSTAPGAFALIAAVLGLGLLRRRRA